MQGGRKGERMRISAVFDSVDAAERAADLAAAATYVGHRTVTHASPNPTAAYTLWPFPPMEGGRVGGVFGNDLPIVPQPLTFPGQVWPTDGVDREPSSIRLELEVPDGAGREVQRLLTNAHGREIRLRH